MRTRKCQKLHVPGWSNLTDTIPTVRKLGKPGERRPLAEAQCKRERRVKMRLERLSQDQIRQNLDKKFVQCNVKPLKGYVEKKHCCLHFNKITLAAL